MKILNYCRHRTAGWEGVIYQNDEGYRYITNGLAIWDLNEKRQSALQMVDCIDMSKLCGYAEKFCPYGDVLSMLQAAGA